MAAKTVIVCDYPLDQDDPMATDGCPNQGKVTVEVSLGSRRFEGDYCKEHAQKLQARLVGIGMRPMIHTQDAKLRNAYLGKSGLPFSGEEARAWLMEKGYDVKPRGRLSAELIEIYAEAH